MINTVPTGEKSFKGKNKSKFVHKKNENKPKVTDDIIKPQMKEKSTIQPKEDNQIIETPSEIKNIHHNISDQPQFELANHEPINRVKAEDRYPTIMQSPDHTKKTNKFNVSTGKSKIKNPIVKESTSLLGKNQTNVCSINKYSGLNIDEFQTDSTYSLPVKSKSTVTNKSLSNTSVMQSNNTNTHAKVSIIHSNSPATVKKTSVPSYSSKSSSQKIRKESTYVKSTSSKTLQNQKANSLVSSANDTSFSAQLEEDDVPTVKMTLPPSDLRLESSTDLTPLVRDSLTNIYSKFNDMSKFRVPVTKEMLRSVSIPVENTTRPSEEQLKILTSAQYQNILKKEAEMMEQTVCIFIFLMVA